MSTYTCTTGPFTPAANATDIWGMTLTDTSVFGRILNLRVYGTQTTGAVSTNLSILRRITTNTGGTKLTPLIFRHDTGADNPALSSVFAYTANPSALGTAAAVLVNYPYYQPASTDKTSCLLLDWAPWTDGAGQTIEAVTLNPQKNANMMYVVSNGGAALPNGAANYCVEVTWTENTV